MSAKARQKVMTTPISHIFRLLQQRQRCQIWIFENTTIRMEGIIIGFDEYMNLVLDEAAEINLKTKSRTSLGKILLKGENITLIQTVEQSTAMASEFNDNSN